MTENIAGRQANLNIPEGCLSFKNLYLEIERKKIN
jgi:peptide deformylase